MTGIIDYSAGNIKSVERALSWLGAEYIISKNPRDLEHADRFIFPGVGDARYAMKQLAASGFDTFLKEAAAAQKPILGICLGSQIIFDYSEEGETPCLGLIRGTIRHFDNLLPERTSALRRIKIPHIGWNDISFTQKDGEGNSACPVFAGVPNHSDFYFVHSYVIQPAEDNVVLAYADYGIDVPAAVMKDSVCAVQFHPEKSGKAGLQILKNFCICP